MQASHACFPCSAIRAEDVCIRQWDHLSIKARFHAVEHLRNSILGETWANDVPRAMNPQTISFSEVGTNLHCALLLRDELSAIAATHNLGHGGSSGRYRRAKLANAFYQNQGTYGKPYSWIHLIGSERWDGQRRETHWRKLSRSGLTP
jgi:hypothetical protein